MAKLIEFYVPERFRLRRAEVPAEDRGKVIEFRPRSDEGKDDLWRRFVLLPLRSVASDVPGR